MMLAYRHDGGKGKHMKRLIDLIVLIILMASSPAQAMILEAGLADDIREAR